MRIAANPSRADIERYADHLAWMFTPQFYRRKDLADLPVYYDNGA